MPSITAAPDEGPGRRPRKPGIACGMLVWMVPDGAEGPTFYEARRLRVSKASGDHRAYSLTRPGVSGRHVVTLGPDGTRCSCPDFAFNQAANGPEGCKHCRALSTLGLL